jgi:hypothetical protein
MRGTEMTETRPRPGEPGAGAEDATTIRPFQISFPDEDLVELRRRIEATRWPERETVDDDSQGSRYAGRLECRRSLDRSAALLPSNVDARPFLRRPCFSLSRP